MQARAEKNYYNILGADLHADDKTLKKCFRDAALQHHPDKGGSDEAFQKVNEAWQILSDASKRAAYDQECKRMGWKDGQGGPKGPQAYGASKTQRQNSAPRGQQQQQQQPQQPKEQPKSSNVEIPAELSKCSIKELKEILDKLGIKRDDCFEKSDMIKKIEDYQAGKSGAKTNKPQESSGQSSAPPGGTKSAFTPSGQDFTLGPKPDNVCFKITSVGSQEVGKSCLIKRYCEGRFVKRYISTIGVDYGVKKLSLKDQNVSISFFDLSGNEDYKLVRTDFYDDTNGVIMVFDVDNRDSFSSLVHWEEEMKRSGVDMSRVKVIVCGNKADSKGREVQQRDAQQWAQKRSYQYFETSAATDMNVKEAFESLFSMCLDQHLEDKRKFRC